MFTNITFPGADSANSERFEICFKNDTELNDGLNKTFFITDYLTWTVINSTNVTPAFKSKDLFASKNGFTAKFHKNSTLGYTNESGLFCLSGPGFQKFFDSDLTSENRTIGFTLIFNDLSKNYSCVNDTKAA